MYNNMDDNNDNSSNEDTNDSDKDTNNKNIMQIDNKFDITSNKKIIEGLI